MNRSTILLFVLSILFSFTIFAQSPCFAVDDAAGVKVQSATQGPVVLAHDTAFYSSLNEVNQLESVPMDVKSINANAGDWLVFAALVAVDGPGDDDFVMDGFSVNWAESFESDISRLEHNKHFHGKKIVAESATQKILFVTDTIKIRDNADPQRPVWVTVSMKDRFGNETILRVDYKCALALYWYSWPEITLKIDGKSQTDPSVAFSNLGIGNKGPDCSLASFEMYPGARMIVEATISNLCYYSGEAPDTILLDASDLYPSGLKTMTDEIIPSVTHITENDEIYAKWEYIAFDVSNILPRVADSIDEKPRAGSGWLFDQSNINWLAYGKEYTFILYEGYTPARFFNGPIIGATPTSFVDLNGITTSETKVNDVYPRQFACTLGGPKGDGTLENMQDVIDSMQGLPYITLQKDAVAKRVASVTVYVADADYQFSYEQCLAAIFTVDTEPPRASVVYSVTHALPVKHRITSGPRIGFPTAPFGEDRDIFDYPPRVREYDCVAVIVSITNSSIDGTRNDAFRPLPGYMPFNDETDFFCIDAADASSIRDVTADSSAFSSLPGMEDVSVFDPNVPVPYPDSPNVVTIQSQGTNLPDLITATFTVRVTGDRGLSAAACKDPVEVTPTVFDDAGNTIADTAYDKGVMLDGNDSEWRALHPQSVLAVDNLGPDIREEFAVEILSGTAILSESQKIVWPGDAITEDAIVSPSSSLKVTCTISDEVDHPFDLIAAQKNYGAIQLITGSTVVADATLDSSWIVQTATNSIQVPFILNVPDIYDAKKPYSFNMVVRATDTVGNTSERELPIRLTVYPTQYNDGVGPIVLAHDTAFYATLREVNRLESAPMDVDSINALPGDWLVFAALVVVDGPGDDDFIMDDFYVNWKETFEVDIERLDHANHYQGKKIVSESATQTILFVTDTIPVLYNADPRNAARVTVSMKDRFGNGTVFKVDEQCPLAISGGCFHGAQITLKIDRKSETDPCVAFSKLGIGNKGPDSSMASFEVFAGARFVVEATVFTINGGAPDTILLDVSDLYPVGLKTMTDEILPSAQRLTEDGVINAKWEYLTYDVSNLLPRVADTVETNPKEGAGWFFDQSNLNWLSYGSEYTIDPPESYTPERRFNGPILGATPASCVDLNGITTADTKVNNVLPSQFAIPLGGPNGDGILGSMREAIDSLQGLPYITVQKDATAKRIAAVTVFKRDKDYIRHIKRYEFSLSALFAVDTEPPRASIVYSVTHALASEYKFTSGARIGFPTAPYGSERDFVNYPPRVREYDCVAVIVSITNATIDGTDNDAFRYLPGHAPSDLENGFFRIDAADASTVCDVTADLSVFSSLPGLDNVSVLDPNVPVPYPDYPNIVTIRSQGVNRPDLITATFTVRVTADRGLTETAGREPVSVTPTVVDDAGNRIMDTPFDRSVLLDHNDR